MFEVGLGVVRAGKACTFKLRIEGCPDSGIAAVDFRRAAGLPEEPTDLIELPGCLWLDELFVRLHADRANVSADILTEYWKQTHWRIHEDTVVEKGDGGHVTSTGSWSYAVASAEAIRAYEEDPGLETGEALLRDLWAYPDRQKAALLDELEEQRYVKKRKQQALDDARVLLAREFDRLNIDRDEWRAHALALEGNDAAYVARIEGLEAQHDATCGLLIEKDKAIELWVRQHDHKLVSLSQAEDQVKELQAANEELQDELEQNKRYVVELREHGDTVATSWKLSYDKERETSLAWEELYNKKFEEAKALLKANCEYDAELDKAEERAQSWEGKYHKERKTALEWKEAYDTKFKETEQLNQNVATLNAELAKVNEKVHAWETLSEMKCEEVKALEQKINELNGVACELNDEIDGLNDALDELNTSTNAAAASAAGKAELVTQLGDMVRELVNVAGQHSCARVDENGKLSAQLLDAKVLLQDRANEHAKLSAQLLDAKVLLGQRTADADSFVAANKKLVEENAKLVQRLDSEHSVVLARTAAVDSLVAANREARDQIITLENAHQAYAAEVQEGEKAYTDLEARYDRLRDELYKTSNELHKTTNELASSHKCAEAANARVNKLEYERRNAGW